MSCIICIEIFKKADDIWSTNCGHVFHSQCLQNWLQDHNTCPQCRKNGPAKFKLYMNFPDSEDDNANPRLNLPSTSTTSNASATNEMPENTDELEIYIRNLSLEERVKELERKLVNSQTELEQQQQGLESVILDATNAITQQNIISPAALAEPTTLVDNRSTLFPSDIIEILDDDEDDDDDDNYRNYFSNVCPFINRNNNDFNIFPY